jgi:hypothetical protein
MDHTYIEEHQIADRYVQGTLPEDEAERFENHYLSCPECLDSLDLAESVQRGFRRAATQDAERLAATRQLALLAWLGRLSRRSQVGVLLSALLVLTVLPAGLGVHGIAERDRELTHTRAVLADERRHTAGNGTLRANLDATQHALDVERAAQAQAVRQIAQMQQPQGNVPILFLDKERGAGPTPEAPTQRLLLPATGPVVLAPQVDRPFQRSYRARLVDGNGREVCHWQDLHPDDHDALGLSLAASRLQRGDYSLVVEGVTPAERFTFSVLR